MTGMEGEADHRRSMRAEVIAELREQVGARVARTARTVRPPLRLNASLRSLLVADLYGTGTGTGTGTGADAGAATLRPAVLFARLLERLRAVDAAAAADPRWAAVGAQLAQVDGLEAGVRAGDADAVGQAMAGALGVDLLLQSLLRDLGA